MFDSVARTESLPTVPLHQTADGIAGFFLFYNWAARDPRFTVHKDNLVDLLKFVGKFEVEVLEEEIIAWTRSQNTQDAEFLFTMILHCLDFPFLRKELCYWYEKMIHDEAVTLSNQLMAAPQFKAMFENSDIYKFVLACAFKQEQRLYVNKKPHETTEWYKVA